jgi:hypothetical protein
MFCFVTDLFPGSLLDAAAACYRGWFHVKWDTLYIQRHLACIEEMSNTHKILDRTP